ncbi:MAG: pseudouridine synthase [Lachnospiraceae bacterium]|jgi:23S rRNA pseudouridine2604 synthase
MENEKVRLNKYLSEQGVCSRREADRLTEQGKITVNGVPAVLGMKVSPDDSITVNGRKIAHTHVRPVLIAVNKPVGVVCTTAEFPGEYNIVEMVNYPTRIYPIGRLDKDSEGLILMTNQGELVNDILKSSADKEKEYKVRIQEVVTPEFIRRMQSGVYLPELEVTTKPCRVRQTGVREFSIILTQGLNRQIRRMCEELGCHVVSLRRVRIMNIRLGNIPSGHYRNVSESEFEEMVREF